MILSLLLLAAPARAAAPAAVAGSVVRSKEWIVRRGKAQEEEFVGDVRYDAVDAHLSADWALYRHAEDDWRARGRVRATRTLKDGDLVEARGETARFSRKTGAGSLEPASGARVSLTRTPPQGGPDFAEGDRLDWRGETSAVLTGRARGWGPRGEFWAETAAYGAVPSRSLTLSGGRPAARRLEDGVSALKADRIVAFDSPRRVEARGRALGWTLLLPPPPPRASSKSKKKDRSAPVCVEPRPPEAPAAGDGVSALLAPVGGADADDARFWEAKSAALAGRSCWGARVDFWADSAVEEGSAPPRRLTLEGGRPVLRKIDADWSAAIKGDRVEGGDLPRRIEARGRVVGWLLFPDETKSKEKAR